MARTKPVRPGRLRPGILRNRRDFRWTEASILIGRTAGMRAHSLRILVAGARWGPVRGRRRARRRVSSVATRSDKILSGSARAISWRGGRTAFACRRRSPIRDRPRPQPRRPKRAPLRGRRPPKILRPARDPVSETASDLVFCSSGESREKCLLFNSRKFVYWVVGDAGRPVPTNVLIGLRKE